MSNTTIRTRKAPALIEDTGITWSSQCARLARGAALALAVAALSACGVDQDPQALSDLAAYKEMSVPVYNNKDDCDKAASIAGKSLQDASDLNFMCETVDTTQLASADNTTPTTGTTHHSGGGGGNPMMWYMMGQMMGNRSGMASSSSFAPSVGSPTPSAFINSAGNGKMSLSPTPQYATPSPSQYAGLKTNGGLVKSGMIGSNVTRAAAYKASVSSVGSKTSVASSVGHSSGGRSGGGGGGGG